MSVSSDPRDATFALPLETSKLARVAGRSATTILAFSILKVVVTLGTTAVLARYILPFEHGLFAMVVPIILILSGLSEFGLSQAVVQRPDVTHRLVSTLFWFNLALGLILSLAMVLIAGLVAAFYDQPRVEALFYILAPYVLLIVLNTQFTAIMRRQLRIAEIESIGMVATLLASFVAIVAALIGWGVYALIAQLLVQPAFSLAGLSLRTRWRPSAPWKMSFSAARGALRFGGYLAAERLLGEVMRNLLLVIIGRSFSEVAAALFHRSQAIAQMPQRRLGAPLLGAFLPALSRVQESGAEFELLFLRILSRSNFILVPLGCSLVLVPDLIVAILLGPQWAAAASILQMYGVLPIFAMTLTCLSTALIACGRSKELFFFRVASVGMLAVALAFGVSQGLSALVGAYLFTLLFFSGGLLACVTVRYTPLSARVLLGYLSGEAAYSVLVLGVGLGLRHVTELSVFLEASIALTWVLLAVLVRVSAKPDLKADILKAIRLAKAEP